jgi:hypothetical protein
MLTSAFVPFISIDPGATVNAMETSDRVGFEATVEITGPHGPLTIALYDSVATVAAESCTPRFTTQ